MTEPFDPYLKWLGIRDAERPPNHYRLLGLDLFESDPDVINGAADRQMSHVRTFQTGAHAAESQKLLNELAVARRCLLNQESRDAYDLKLQSKNLEVHTQRSAAPLANAKIIDDFGGGRLASHRDKIPKSFWIMATGWIGGGIAALVLAYFLINSSLFQQEAKLVEKQTDRNDNSRPSVSRSKTAADLDPPVQSEKTQTLPLSAPSGETKEARTKKQTRDKKNNKSKTAANDKTNSTDTAKPPAPKPPTMSPKTNPITAVAPWDQAERLPELPDFISQPNSEADLRFQPVYIGLAMRQYDLVRKFYPKVESFSDQLSKPIDVNKALSQLDQFWQQVHMSAQQLRLGDTLSWSGQIVKVKAVSDRAIELLWVPTEGASAPSSSKLFPIGKERMDRGLAIALAEQNLSQTETVVESFRQLDFLHANIPVPPELTIGSGVNLNPEAGMLGTEESLKLALPEKQDLLEAQNTIQDLYSGGLSKQNFWSQQQLGSQLIADATSARDSALRYALLDEVRQLGIRWGEGELVFRSLSEMNDAYQFDYWDNLPDALSAAMNRAKSDVQFGSITNGAFKAIDQAVQHNQLEVATRLAKEGLAAAKKLGVENQIRIFDDYRKQLNEMIEWADLAPQALDRIKTDPDNTKARLAAGRHLCFVKGDWEAGREHLAQSGSSKLTRIIQQEQDLNNDNVKSSLSLADAWYDLGNNNKGTTKRGMLNRAHYWYSKAKEKASGLDREKALLRINELQQWVNFFKPYLDDEVFVQTQTWRFRTKNGVVFQTASFQNSTFTYDLPSGPNRRRRQRMNLDKTGDTYQGEPADTDRRVCMRLMRDYRIELLLYDMATGQLVDAGLGETIKP